jgi:YidC/Oxa1 family membrane protein insertase
MEVESSIAMQGLQPRVKELQAMYANDAERLQMETARLYKEAGPCSPCTFWLHSLAIFL